MSKLHLSIVTPERIVFEDEVDSVSVMTDMGEVTILVGHVPLIANLRAGELRLKKDGLERLMVASTGFLQVRPGNQIVILADSAERADELELEKIEEARDRARKLLEEKRNANDVAFVDAAAMMERELARYRVALKSKKYKDVGKQR
ncbi:ATP synthase F1 subunit epsilon [Candidatus Uhrbacteria bacterium]|nr:ATP synthase F1 subunit epsilon [Candidatus Uhrbacteria bacterium]